MSYIFINGIPLTTYPIRVVHLADIAEVEDVEYEEITDEEYEND